MITTLRTRHRRLWWTLALALPLALALALWTRRPAVMMNKLPPALSDVVSEEAKS